MKTVAPITMRAGLISNSAPRNPIRSRYPLPTREYLFRIAGFRLLGGARPQWRFDFNALWRAYNGWLGPNLRSSRSG
jgi:hypothetical protein